ncbi:S41 family peptidase [Ferviditalea candida]|uniref:S41 family peptidase n=1 Tax=Ferviditalea candida TaxID=3108399 RepID=A0ABU5ZIP3_9BACL|nr:S41 family peptidase [Paenibacillaceae bacterium T2]
MLFKGRTVLALVLAALFAGSIMTLTFIGTGFSFPPVLTKDHPIQASPGNSAAPGAGAENSAKETDGLSKADIQKINTTYQLIEHKFISPMGKDKIVDGAIRGMLESLNDPFSTYMDKEEAGKYNESVDAYFTGIGAEVTMEGGRVTVMSPIKDSPAEKAGIHAKDMILSVNGAKLEGLSLTEAVMKIRGPKGTQAKLEILRPGMKEPIQIIVVRDEISIETVSSEMLDQQIGKIQISQFSSNTADRFKQELAALESKGLKGLIIDVRNNPGGYLYGVLNLLESLVPNGKTLVQVEYRDQEKTQTVSKGSGKAYPIVVLVNEGSASASEIMAAALKESAGATLVGEKTYGKGTVQTTYEKELGDGSNIKMTIAKWLTPSGNWIHKKGIEPDIKVQQPAYFKTAPLNRDVEMKYDAAGDPIRNLQMMLTGLGLNPGRTDGYFSEKTAQAVKVFQRQHGLPVTGAVNAKTADLLEDSIIKTIRDPKNDLQLQEAIKVLKQKIGAR